MPGAALALLAAAACHGAQPAAPSDLDYAGLLAALRAAGASVVSGGEVRQPFFAVPGRIAVVDGEDVQAFEYASARAAEQDASRVSPDGSSIGGSRPSWIGPPHFYRKGRLLALYVGERASVKAALERALGPQFAGR